MLVILSLFVLFLAAFQTTYCNHCLRLNKISRPMIFDEHGTALIVIQFIFVAAGFTMLFISVHWWGLLGIAGYWFLVTFVPLPNAMQILVVRVISFPIRVMSSSSRRSEDGAIDWFQRHLNWTWVFAYMIWFPLNAVPISIPLTIAYFGTLIFLVVISGWVIKQKERSLWWLLLIPVFSPLWLKQQGYFGLCDHAHKLHHSGGLANDQKAVSLYKRAIDMKPDYPDAHAGLGLIHYDNALTIERDYSTAPGGSWLMFADEESPEEEDKFSLTTSYADEHYGNRKIAIRELEAAANLATDKNGKFHPDWSQAGQLKALDMAADIHCIIDIEEGIKAYKNILQIEPDYVPAHFYLASCYAESYRRHKQSAPTSYNGEHFKDNDRLALEEYEFIKKHAPQLASDLESVLARNSIKMK